MRKIFEFAEEGEDEDVALAFRVVDSYENEYGDAKAAVETPAPWEVPDDVTPPNEIVKGLAWEEVHYTFDREREAWTIDADGLRPLAEAAEDAGYGWESRPENRQDAEDDEVCETLNRLTESVSMGDEIAVKYEKKNGNGTNVYEGQVTDFRLPNAKGRTVHVTFVDPDGKTKRVKEGDRGDVGLFSSGYHPYMGNVLKVSVE